MITLYNSLYQAPKDIECNDTMNDCEFENGTRDGMNSESPTNPYNEIASCSMTTTYIEPSNYCMDNLSNYGMQYSEQVTRPYNEQASYSMNTYYDYPSYNGVHRLVGYGHMPGFALHSDHSVYNDCVYYAQV